jgi:hypothetical protein
MLGERGMGLRTFDNSERLQHAVDEEDAVEGLAEGLDFADAILVVWFGPVGRECGRELGEVQHFGGQMWVILTSLASLGVLKNVSGSLSKLSDAASYSNPIDATLRDSRSFYRGLGSRFVLIESQITGARAMRNQSQENLRGRGLSCGWAIVYNQSMSTQQRGSQQHRFSRLPFGDRDPTIRDLCRALSHLFGSQVASPFVT